MFTGKLHSKSGQWNAALCAVPLAFSLAAFAAPVSAAEGLLIGVVFPTQQHARVAFEIRILEETAEANGDEVIVQYSMESAATQKNQVETMIERGIDVLILQAIDAKAASDLVKQAQERASRSSPMTAE